MFVRNSLLRHIRVTLPVVGLRSATTRATHQTIVRQKLIDEIIRVDQAGEVAAVAIYQGQLWALRNEPERALVKVNRMASYDYV